MLRTQRHQLHVHKLHPHQLHLHQQQIHQQQTHQVHIHQLHLHPHSREKLSESPNTKLMRILDRTRQHIRQTRVFQERLGSAGARTTTNGSLGSPGNHTCLVRRLYTSPTNSAPSSGSAALVPLPPLPLSFLDYASCGSSIPPASSASLSNF